MSNRKQRLVPLALSGILFVVYTVTLVVWLLQGTPVVFLDFLATYGVWLLLTVAGLWLPTPYYAASMLFAFVAQYGGMVWDCYNRFSWFDVGRNELGIAIGMVIVIILFMKFVEKITNV